MKLAATLIALIMGTCTLLAEDNTMRFEKYGFAVRTPKGWHVADPKLTKLFSTAIHKGVVAHAMHTAPTTDVSTVESDVLMLVTKHPLGAREDNPNVTVSVEKSWRPAPQNTGATHLKLLAERFALLKVPSRLKDAPQKVEFGGVVFFMQDAVNDKVPDATTLQQYFTAYMAGCYVTFIISYNDKKDSDYQAMRAMVESITPLKKDVQPKPEGDGKPAH